jgi:hypothetical protein
MGGPGVPREGEVTDFLLCVCLRPGISPVALITARLGGLGMCIPDMHLEIQHPRSELMRSARRLPACWALVPLARKLMSL